MAWSKRAIRVAQEVTCNIPGIAVSKPRVTIPRAPKAPKGIKGLHTKVGGGLKQSSKGVGKIQKAAIGIRSTKLGQRAPGAGVIKQPKVAAAPAVAKPRKLYSTAPRKPTKGSFTKGDKRFAGIQAKRAAARPPKAPAAAPSKPSAPVAPAKVPPKNSSYSDRRAAADIIKTQGRANKQSPGEIANIIRGHRGMKPMSADHPYMKKHGAGVPTPAAAPAKGQPGRFSPKASPAPASKSGGSQHHYFRVKLKNGKMGTARAKGLNQADAARKVAKHGVTPAGYIGRSGSKISAKDAGKHHKAATKPPTAKLISRDNGPATSISKAPAHKYQTGSNKWAKQKLSQGAKKVGGWLKKKFGVRNAYRDPETGKVTLFRPQRVLKPATRSKKTRDYMRQRKRIPLHVVKNQRGLTIMAWSPAAIDAARTAIENAKRNTPKQTSVSRAAASLYKMTNTPRRTRKKTKLAMYKMARSRMETAMAAVKNAKRNKKCKDGIRRKLKRANLDNPKHAKALLKIFG